MSAAWRVAAIVAVAGALVAAACGDDASHRDGGGDLSAATGDGAGPPGDGASGDATGGALDGAGPGGDGAGVDAPIGDAGGAPDGGCQKGWNLCGNVCVNLHNDPASCGACGNTCCVGLLCSDGHCATPCKKGLTSCDVALDTCAGAECHDLETDPKHCGGCQSPCAPGMDCVGGSCVTGCPPPLLVCGGTCRDVSKDASHCGTCFHACAPSEVCVAKQCIPTCAPGLASCGGACVDLAHDPDHCGACNHACAGQVCTQSKCAGACQPPDLLCAGVCVDVTTSRTNCGACNASCSKAQQCIAGQCQ